MTPAQNSGRTAGRMPVGRRFEKGVSGNPGGRPRGSKTYAIRELVAEALNDPNVWNEAVERYRETLKTRKTVINGLEFAARVKPGEVIGACGGRSVAGSRGDRLRAGVRDRVKALVYGIYFGPPALTALVLLAGEIQGYERLPRWVAWASEWSWYVGGLAFLWLLGVVYGELPRHERPLFAAVLVVVGLFVAVWLWVGRRGLGSPV